MILILICLLLTVVYNYWVIKNNGIPESLSETAYTNNKLAFTGYCFSMVLLMPLLLNMTPENFQFLVFLLFGGMLISGFSPMFKQTMTKEVHNIFAMISFIAFVIYMVKFFSPWLAIIYVLILSGLIKWRKESFTYFAEILALLALMVHLIC